ncbi:unnamed protein product [Caenorhabditis sp. 36 PRJEB53466]|nr:unnamed protein product [Caenorhabditis sp. 36 PRJEB53466]
MSTARSFVLIALLLIAVCNANLATGRASLRPSAGKRSAGAVLVGRTPAHYYHLAAKRFDDNEVSCNLNTMAVLNSRYEQLQEEIEEIVDLLEACQTLRNAI